MKFQPTGRRSATKPLLDGIGNRLPRGEYKNPFETINRHVMGNKDKSKRHRIGADTLGATPVRDGPFAMGAADVAVQKPPKARSRRWKERGGL